MRNDERRRWLQNRPDNSGGARPSRATMPLGMVQHQIGKEVMNRRNSTQWRLQQLAKEKSDAEQVDEWFSRFDTNQSNKLEREQVRALCKHVHPEREPTEEALDYIIKKAT